MPSKLLILAAVLLLLGSTLTHADPATCRDQFVGGVAPALNNPKLARDATPLCCHGFAPCSPA